MEKEITLCKVCGEPKPDVKRRMFTTRQLGLIQSKEEMCEECYEGMRKVTEAL